jgi:D-3-phosphoglycerate dehydrogenase
MIETEQGERQAQGAVFPDGSPRLISIDGFYVEAPLKGDLLFMVNQDVPGVIGQIGEILGGSGVNIADFSLGRLEAKADGPATAVSVIRVDQAISADAISQLAALKPVQVARTVRLG